MRVTVVTIAIRRHFLRQRYRAPLPSAAVHAVAAGSGGGGRAVLTFKGINYRANIWVAGQHLSSSTRVEGAYNYHDVDITDALTKAAAAGGDGSGGGAALAVEVFRYGMRM